VNDPNRRPAHPVPGDDLTMVRHLLAEPPPPAPDIVASARAALDRATRDNLGRGRHPHPALRPRRRYRLAAAAAAALLLAGGAAYGLTAGLGGSAPGPRQSTAALTAVTGCYPLKLVAGTLLSVHGTSVVIKASSGGQEVVTTWPGTRVSVLTAPRSVLADGSWAVVVGYASHGTVAAGSVSVGAAPLPRRTVTAVKDIVQGTITDAGDRGFTLVTTAGQHIPVTTSKQTDISAQGTSPGLLRPGMEVLAIGHVQAGRNLTATGLSQLPPLRNPAHFHVAQPNGCTAVDITVAYLATRVAAITP
jgi:hypothetical protein